MNLGCVVHNSFIKNAPSKTRLTDYRILIVAKQLKYLGPVEAIFKVTGYMVDFK